MKKLYRDKLFYLFNQFKEEIIYLRNLEKYKKTFGIFCLIILLLLIVSFGPINHSDTANTYVGYPYQFWKNNSHFIDGNLNQGLMGLGDFANIFYFQDKTTWLIRTAQFITVPFIFIIMLRRNISNLCLFIFLTSPVFIQWLTIGKNNFLSESCLAIGFLAWDLNKEKKYISNILVLVALAISFKVSALLVSLPILFYLFYFYRKEIKNISFDRVLKIFSIPLIFSIFFVCSILLYRYFLVENPFYPFLSKYFNPGDQQLLDWEQTLRGWDRDGLFLFWIFIPKSIGKISFVLGPSNLLLIIASIIYYLRNLNSNNPRLTVGLCQFILLIFFSQGRADYYMTPLILICSGFPKSYLNNFDLNLFRFRFSLLKKQIFSLVIFIQLNMFIIACFYSIGLVFYVLYDYDAAMDKTAYNFYNSRKIEKFAETPVVSEITDMTHLYTNKPFIAIQKFHRCFFYEKNMPEDEKYKYCMEKEAIKTIITKKDKLKSNPFFTCESNNLIRASRNIFLEEKLSVDFCKLK
ncbi:hypothetical protein [Prochlorococcus marinus]|uniref:hypothetical protein n=1 Tax=Prochlorococcus marinus TaxID=1219 RepID=UPI001ADD0987|nr:hypothetical protein [Prochlorococcus marinus]MBO8221450.1 hypothetical protein [Prochlorococcus marinus CUG1417]